MLWKFAFGPIVRMLDGARDAPSATPSTRPSKERDEAEKLLAEQKEALVKAQREAAEMRQANQQEMEALPRPSSRPRPARRPTTSWPRRAKSIEDEKAKAIAELRAEVADLAIEVAARI